MKTSKIEKRPIIIVSSSTTKWEVRKEQDPLSTEVKIVFYQNGKKVTPKPNTLTEGKFKCMVKDGYYDRDIDAEGNFINYPTPPTFYSTAEEALKVLDKKSYVVLVKILDSYYNTETHEKTHDKKVTDKWFKGRNPLFISREKYQQVGIWVEPGEDHVEVKFYVLDSCLPDQEVKWREATDTGFWLYPDGTISHFYKGRLGATTTRTFVTERQIYLTLDPRSDFFQTCQWTPFDLRRKSIIKSDGQSYLISQETLDILKQCGFPERFWTWGSDSSRKIERPYDLISFAKIRQKTSISKEGTKVGLTGKNTDFDVNNLSSLVTVQDKGILIKVPGILLTWNAIDGSETPYASTVWRSSFVPTVRRMEIYCKYQVWIKNDASKFSAVAATHFGTDWETTPFYSVHLDRYDKDSFWDNDKMTESQRFRCKSLATQCNIAYNYILQEIINKLPILQYYKDVFPEYQTPKYSELWSFLLLLNKCPKMLDFVLKQQKALKIDLDIYRREYDYQNPRYSLKAFLEIFGLDESSFKELKTKNMYQNLNVTKEQFRYLVQNKSEANALAMSVLREINVPVPIRTGVPQYSQEKNNKKEYKVGDVVSFRNICYRLEPVDFEIDTYRWVKVFYPHNKFGTDITQIPLKYIQILFDFIEKMIVTHNNYYIRSILTKIFEHYSFEDLSTIANRDLRIQTFLDYLDMIHSVKRMSPDFDDSMFNLIPEDNKQLGDLHREITQVYNLLNQDRYSWYDGTPTEAMTAKYAKKLKGLQEYAMETEDYVVLVPQNLTEIAQEGAALRHCAASYISRVANGETYFFFLRKKDNPTQSLVTFNIVANDGDELNNKWLVDQIHGRCDRSPTTEEANVVRKWAALHGATLRRNY